jgi:hypothetical protein
MQFRQIYFLVELEELDADVVKRWSLKFVNYFWNIIYQHLKLLIFPKLFNVSKTTYMLIDTHFHLRKPLKFVETIFFFFLFTTHIFIFHLSMWSHSKTSFFVCVCVCVCLFYGLTSTQFVLSSFYKENFLLGPNGPQTSSQH